MTATPAVMAIHQVDLDIADTRPLAFKVVTHQAIKVDRGGGAGIDLHIAHLRHLAQGVAHRHQRALGLLETAALGHIQHQLKLRLVVERQHLQHHQLKYRQTDRRQHRQHHGQPQLTPCRRRLRAEQKR